MAHQSKWKTLATEANNRFTRDFDQLDAIQMIGLMTADNQNVMRAIRRQKKQIARAAELVAEAVRSGGRLIFAGAGTSGRLGVLEAAELPPTFGVSRRSVIAIMSGGRRSVYRAAEGAEDDRRDGVRRLSVEHPRGKDVVIGVSASGVTPFVAGVLARARRGRSRIVLVTCARRSSIAGAGAIVISLEVGPEAIAGSTRLKAGTATKIALNMITTSAMVLAGKTYGNLMVDVQANSAKLRDRAHRIVAAVTGLDDANADGVLRRARGNVKAAIVMQMSGVSYSTAVARLRMAGGVVRTALEMRPDRSS